MRELPFIFSQYLKDVRDNANQFLGAKSLKLRTGAKVIAMVAEDQSINASASQTAKDQFLIRLNEGLLKGCFELINRTGRQYYRRHIAELDVTEELFIRTVCGAASEMVFWHEFAHIARGHIFYLRDEGMLPAFEIAECGVNSARTGDTTSDEFNTWQFLELDADIYGAQFLLARLITIQASRGNRISPETWLRVFALGVRSMYEVLHRNGYCVHEAVLDATHPHPLSRAYVAFTHGLARTSDLGISDDVADVWRSISQSTLLEHELLDLGMVVDGAVLEAFAAGRLEEWHENAAVLAPYQLLQAPTGMAWWRTLWEFVRSRFSTHRDKERN